MIPKEARAPAARPYPAPPPGTSPMALRLAAFVALLSGLTACNEPLEGGQQGEEFGQDGGDGGSYDPGQGSEDGADGSGDDGGGSGGDTGDTGEPGDSGDPGDTGATRRSAAAPTRGPAVASSMASTATRVSADQPLAPASLGPTPLP